MKKRSNIDDTIVGFLGIEAMFDAFGVAVDCIERFETLKRPTLYIKLPVMY